MEVQVELKVTIELPCYFLHVFRKYLWLATYHLYANFILLELVWMSHTNLALLFVFNHCPCVSSYNIHYFYLPINTLKYFPSNLKFMSLWAILKCLYFYPPKHSLDNMLIKNPINNSWQIDIFIGFSYGVVSYEAYCHLKLVFR